jgi:hypothetical protein
MVRAGTSDDLAFFEAKIRPVLVEHCYSCHSAKAKKPKGKLLLDSRDGLRKGGESGPALVPGDPEKSLIIRAVRQTDKELQMPPDRKLPASVIADLEAWIKRGAVDPRDKPTTAAATLSWDEVFKERRQWWSVQPVRRPELPNVKDAAWSPRPIDRFILAGLEGAGLTPGAEADARTLIRRLKLVLTGLPPTASESEDFAKAWDAAGAKRQALWEQTVDKLLASPHFGERWARHWMDVVRFAETCGNEWNYEVHHAWRYRDYLIRAFNDDVPYHRLVLEHLAGDLLPPRWNEREQINESLIGTAFWRFGEVNHDDCVEFRQIGYDLFDNQIDALGKTFLASTVACARCHDHKLDAISMKDYYALLGIIRSSRLVSHTIDAPRVNEKPQQNLRDAHRRIGMELARLWRDEAGLVGKYLLAASDKRADAKGLDAARLEKWRAALAAKADSDDLAQPWRALAGTKAGDDFASAWDKLAKQIESESRSRAEFNAKNFVSFGDFRYRRGRDGWQASGQGLINDPDHPGLLVVNSADAGPVATMYPAGIYTHGLSSKLNGTLRSPQLPAGKKYISFRVLGGKTAAVRLVSNNCQLDYIHYKALTKNEWSWIKLKIPADAEGLRSYAELMTKFDNPKFPDQLGTLGGDTHNDRVPWEKAAADPRSFFGVTRAVLHDVEEAPRPDLDAVCALCTGPVRSAEELAERYTAEVEFATRAWNEGKPIDVTLRWLDWLLRRGLLTNDRKASAKLDALVAEYRDAETELSQPRIVPGIADAPESYDQPLLTRGDFNKPGEVIARRFLEVLEKPGPTFAAKGSGRLELAQRIASPDNPLTARVMVNRVWHHLFGAGLVRTVDDFGHLGDRPSHPELLDHLAAEFVADGWSIKRLIRRIVVSRTFQMTARSDAKARVADPDNRLLHHYPARRLEAEAIRDAILAASGRLDKTLFGPSIDPWREKANPDRRLFPGPLDGAGRRSVYIKVNLMEPPKFLGAFDFPGGKVTRGRRDVTNVPAQALALLNDPFVLQQADVWAKRLVAAPDASAADRIEWMFRTALGRPAGADERERFARFVAQLAELHDVPPAGVLGSAAVWRDVGHAMFNMREFITIP